MDRKFLHVRYGRFLIALLIAFTAFVVHSCRKQARMTQAEVKAEMAAQHFPVSAAKEWFDIKKTTLGTGLKINAQAASMLALLADFTPVWDSARTTVDTNYYVVEAPAKYLRKLGFDVDDNGQHIDGLTRLLVMKYKKTGALRAVLMHIKGNPGIAIDNVHYMDVPKQFNGHIFYTTLQGASVCGYIYKDGKVVSARSGKGTIADPKLQVQTADGSPFEGCTTVVTNYYERTCYWTSSNELISCGEWHYMFTLVDYYCPPPQEGGGNVPPPDCDPGGGVVVQSVKGKLVIQLYDGGDGGGGELPPCEPPVTPEAQERFTRDIDSTKLADCAKKVLYLLEKSDPNVVVNFIRKFSGTTPNFKWRLEYKGLASNVNAQTKMIYENGSFVMRTQLDSDKFADGSDLALARTILHECIHAYLIAYFLDDQNMANATYPELMVAYNRTSNYEAAQHAQMTTLLNEMTKLLKAYGQSQKYNIDDQYYHDLTWGGLEDTQAFSDTSINKVSDQKRILDRLNIEQKGVDKVGTPVNKKGKSTGC